MIIDETLPEEEYADYEYAMIQYNHWLSGETINIGVIVLENEQDDLDKKQSSIKKKPVRKAIKTIDSFHCFADILEITEASSLDFILEWIHKDFDKDTIKYGHNTCNAIFITKLDWISDHRRDVELVADALYKEVLFVKAAHHK